MNKKCKGGKKMTQKGFEVPGMAKPRETQRPMEENKI